MSFLPNVIESIGGGSPVSVTGEVGIPQSTSMQRPWWETPLETVTQATADWVSDQMAPGDQGSGYTLPPPPNLPPPPTYGSPTAAGFGGGGIANALLIGAVAFAGLKLARVI